MVISKELYIVKIFLPWGRLFTSRNKTIFDFLSKIYHQYEIRIKIPDFCTIEMKAEMLRWDVNICDGLMVDSL